MAEQFSVKDAFVDAIKETRLASRNYWINREFLLGHQWLYEDEDTGRPETLKGTSRVQGTVNRFATNHRTIMANGLQEELAFETRPNGADDASTFAANVATEALYGLHTDHSWEILRERVTVNALLGGIAGIGLSWDTEADTSIENPLTIAEFVVEPGSKDAETARWWVQAQTLPQSKVKDMYGLSELPHADATSGMNATQRGMLSRYLGEGDIPKLTIVLTYYERPSAGKKGRVITEVGGEHVESAPWPFPFEDRLNLVTVTETMIPDRWYGDTIYSQARWPQVAMNVAKSNLSEHLSDAAVARLLVPHSAIRVMEAFDDVPGNQYPYADNMEKPSWLNPAQLPAWLQNTPHDFAKDIDDIMGVHAVSRGEAPANLESGTAISILSEQDGSPVGHVLRSVAGAFSRMSSLLLQMHEELSTGTKRGIIRSEDGSPLSTEWTGKDIAGQYDARVPYDSIIPRSRAAQMQSAVKMLEMGLITDMDEFVRFSQMPNGRNLINASMPATAHARREHRKFAIGEIIVPEEWEAHKEHIDAHQDFLYTEVFARLASEDKEKIHLHIQAHRTLEAEALAADVSRQTADPNMSALTGAAQLPVPPGQEIPPQGLPPGPEQGNLPPDLDQQLLDLQAEL